MWAPSRVGAIDPVGITNASTTNARKMNARMNAIRIDSSVSFTPPSCGAGLDAAAEGSPVASGVAGLEDESVVMARDAIRGSHPGLKRSLLAVRGWVHDNSIAICPS